MNVRKFIAATARDALRKVKEMLGPDAIILSNRAIPGGVEIMAVAACDMETIVPPPPVRHEYLREDDFTVRLSASKAPSMAGAAVSAAAMPVPPLSPRPVPQIDRVADAGSAKAQAEIITAEMMEEIRSLRRAVEQHLAGAAWGESVRSEPVKTEILRRMLDAGFSPSLARELLTGLPRELDATKALNWTKQAADRALLTISGDSDIVDRGGRLRLGRPDRCRQNHYYGKAGRTLRASARGG